MVRLLPRGTNQVWLAQSDLEWLVTYIGDEVACGGVEVDEDGPAVAEPNCDVAGLRIEWDFQSGHSWKADFVKGPCCGQKITSSVDKMTSEKWEMMAKVHGYTATFEQASFAERKKATRDFLEHHCRERLKNAGA